MGCDIHGTVEVKRSNLGGGKGLWFTVLKVGQLLRRNYDMFAHLFGVRHYEGEHEIEAEFIDDGYLEPKELFADRGLPEDISDTTQREYNEWELDAHSESFVYQHELSPAISRTSLEHAAGWKQAISYGEDLADFFSDDEYLDGTVRWVVWFDN